MFKLLLMISLSVVNASETPSIEMETVSTFNSFRSNGDLLDAALKRVTDAEKPAVRAFFDQRKIKLEERAVRAHVNAGELRLVAADGRVARARSLNAVQGQFRLAGVDLDLDRRRSALERLLQIETILSRKHAHRSALVVSEANAYVATALSALILGAFVLYQHYQDKAQLRSIIWANRELNFAKADCQRELKKVVNAGSDKPILASTSVRAPELLSARQQLNKISTSYVCREPKPRSDTPESQQMTEGCGIIDEIHTCIREIAAKTMEVDPKVVTIAEHTGEAVKLVSWRSGLVETIRGNQQQADLSR